jgi:meiotically up-regulated gene 157 (Mug157) protein
VYENTRAFLLSSDNPSYFASSNGKFKGIGSVKHTGIGNIWPMSQLMQGMVGRRFRGIDHEGSNDVSRGWLAVLISLSDA